MLHKLMMPDSDKLPDLDEAVINALNFFSGKSLDLNISFKFPIVAGSGNAVPAGKILFSDKCAGFSTESTFRQVYETYKNYADGVVVISSSGSKDSVQIAEFFQQKNIPVKLLTCTENSECGHVVGIENTIVSPKLSEPYTYNTSTYMGMILGKTRENPEAILRYLEATDISGTIGKYSAYVIVVPDKFVHICDMYKTKFDELLCPHVFGRAFTEGTARHAKNISISNEELWIGIGANVNYYGTQRLHIPIPENADYGLMMAVGYYLIGKIQKTNYPWFKENIEEYCKVRGPVPYGRTKPFDVVG